MIMRRTLFISALALALTLLLTGQQAIALTLGFHNITNNNPADLNVADQLFVDVIDAGSGQVLFWFRNEGPTTSFISEVYFDDGTLLGIAGLIDADDTALASPPAPSAGNSGVDFTQDAVDPVNPPDLPGGDSISPIFEVSHYFSADADSPGTGKDGVDENEWLGILFDLLPGTTYGDVVDQLDAGTLRIGLHVQGIDAPDVGKSDSFVNNIPDASTLLLLGSASLIGLAGLRRRSK